MISIILYMYTCIATWSLRSVFIFFSFGNCLLIFTSLFPPIIPSASRLKKASELVFGASVVLVFVPVKSNSSSKHWFDLLIFNAMDGKSSVCQGLHVLHTSVFKSVSWIFSSSENMSILVCCTMQTSLK